MSMLMMGQIASKSVFNGKTGYETNQMGQKIEMDSKDIENNKFYAHPFPEMKLAQKPGVALAGIENFNGKDAYVIADGDKKLFYDVATGLKVGEVQTMEMQGQTMSQTFMYDDYKEVKGVKYAHKLSLDIGMGMPFDFIVSELKVNEGVSDADFE